METGCQQLISNPTWRRCVNIGGTLTLRESKIDHVYSNFNGTIDQSHTLGDHDIIKFTFENTKKGGSVLLKVRDW